MTVVNQLILASKDPLGHNYDYPILSIDGWAILTNHIVIMFLIAIFMIWWMPRVGRAVMTGKTGTSHDYVTKGPFAHMIEVFCVFFRNDIAKPVMGPYTDRYIPLIWTMFFFILFCNLSGMIPLMDVTSLTAEMFSGGNEQHVAMAEEPHGDAAKSAEEAVNHSIGGEADSEQAHGEMTESHAASGEHGAEEAGADHAAGGHHVTRVGPFVLFQDLTQKETASHFHGFGGTPTGNIAVTFALALIAILMVIGSAIRNLGLGGFLHHLTLDAPVPLWPLTILLEIIGLIAKPFALMVRLFANMTAGHIMLAALVGFTSMAWNGFVYPPVGDFSVGGFIGFIPLSIATVVFATAIGLLEVLVAFIQAFVFAFLTTMFISMFLPHEHDHEHGHAMDMPDAPDAAVTF